MTPEKYIDNEIGIWLAHTQFWIQKKNIKQNK